MKCLKCGKINIKLRTTCSKCKTILPGHKKAVKDIYVSDDDMYNLDINASDLTIIKVVLKHALKNRVVENFDNRIIFILDKIEKLRRY